jgi:transcriptional regulator with XRE-family HTH domain
MELHPNMDNAKTTEEVEKELGHQIRSLRLRKNLDQERLSERAGVALSALKNLESGKGAALKTFIKVLRALERLEWLNTLAPTVSISPMQMLHSKPGRQRASRKRAARE